MPTTSTKSRSPKYPTKEQILAKLYQPSPDELWALNGWKAAWYNKKWRTMRKPLKAVALGHLITLMSGQEDVLQPLVHVAGEQWAYYQSEKVIEFDMAHPSIISALHELSHHLHGRSELTACRYSIGVFKAGFPQAFNKLAWRGHQLVKSP